MVGGRRRRRSSASSTTSNAKGSVSSAPETLRPPPIQPASSEHTMSTASLPQLSLDTADDPFAYDSELETLSSVSSHSSIAGSEGSILDQALSAASDLQQPQLSEDEDDDQNPPQSADLETHSEDALSETLEPKDEPDNNDDNGGGSKAGSKASADDEEEEEGDDEDNVADEARRSAALTELTSIEIAFAQLRERLYIERLQQVQIEEDYLLSGQHSEYERCVEELSSGYSQQLEKLHFAHNAWLKQREQLHETWKRTVNYTFLVRRQELRRGLVSAQQRRQWRLRDMRVREDRRHAEKSTVDEDLALIAQTSDVIQQIKHARRVTVTAQRCMVHARKQPLAVSGLDEAEMDADYRAMSLPVHPREKKPGFRHIFVPPLAAEPALAGKKRKPRQPRQPKKKPALERDRADAANLPRVNGQIKLVQPAAQSAGRPALPPVAEDPGLVAPEKPNSTDIHVLSGLKV